MYMKLERWKAAAATEPSADYQCIIVIGTNGHRICIKKTRTKRP